MGRLGIKVRGREETTGSGYRKGGIPQARNILRGKTGRGYSQGRDHK